LGKNPPRVGLPISEKAWGSGGFKPSRGFGQTPLEKKWGGAPKFCFSSEKENFWRWGEVINPHHLSCLK